jgi:hypothetical protein
MVYGCSPTVEKGIEGMWVIERIVYKNEDILTCLGVNALNFKEKNWKFPAMLSKDCPDDGVSDFKFGKWEVVRDGSDYFLKVEGESKIFTGKYHIEFINDISSGTLKLILHSSTLIITCNKLFYDYNGSTKMTQELVKATQRG